MKNKKFLALALLPVLALSACAQDDGYKVKVVTPSGAPGVAFYDAKKSDEKLDVRTDPKTIPPEFKKGTADMVIFDFYNGLNAIKKFNAPYKLARILTGGNLYLVGLNKTEAPTKNDKIVMFGENLLPDLVFKKLYGETINQENVSYVPGVSALPPVMISGKLNSVEQNYVVVAQPVLNVVLSKPGMKDKIHVIESLRTKWTAETNQDMIPQAGLFVNTNTYGEHKVAFENELKRVDERVNTAINSVDKVVETMDANATKEEQTAFFGFNSAVIKGVQDSKLTPNGLALVDPAKQTNRKDVVSKFLKALQGDKAVDYSSYIL